MVLYNRGATYNSGFRYKGAVIPANNKPKKKGRPYMAGNPVPRDNGTALALGEEVADGLHALAATLSITGTTEAGLRALLSACRAADSEVGKAQKLRTAADVALQGADDAASLFLSAARKVLVLHLGAAWSDDWAPTGFPNESTAVPLQPADRMNLCFSLSTYFTENPTQEFATQNVTAAKALENFNAISDCKDDFDTKDAALTNKKQARDASYVALRKELHGFIAEVSKRLGDDDARWHEFGLNAPCDPNAPEATAAPVLRVIPGPEIMATWKRSARAIRYRPFVQILGVDAEARGCDSVRGLETVLRGFAAGQTVKVYIVAANDDGTAPASPTEQILIP